MTTPVYPNSYFTWQDRIDSVDIDYAEDINAVAADLGAVEDTLGLNPQNQANPMLGPDINFVNVGQRLDYITAMSHVPVCQISSQSSTVPNLQGPGSNYGVFNVYNSVDYDPFGLFNGSDITCAISGFYLVNISQFWNWFSTGYNACHFYIDSTWKCAHRWDWDFVGNEPGGYWRGGPTYDFARQGSSQVWWMGVINQGQRLRVVSENGTSFSPCTVTNMEFKAALLRRTPTSTATLPAPAAPLTTIETPTVTRFLAPGFLNCVVVSGVVTLNWGVVISPIYAPSYTIAVYYNTYPFGLAHFETFEAPGVIVSELTYPISTLGSGSYTVHVYANSGVLDPPHAVSSFVI